MDRTAVAAANPSNSLSPLDLLTLAPVASDSSADGTNVGKWIDKHKPNL